MAKNGKLGKLTTLHAEAGPGNRWPPATTHAWLPAEPEPTKQVCDWDRWLGPAPWRTYNSQYVARRLAWILRFHGGGILEWESHTADLCQWVADTDDITPIEFDPKGVGSMTPYSIECRYANGLKLVLRDSGFLGLGTCHIRYEGTAGRVETADSGKIAVSDNLKSETFAPPTPETKDPTTNHVRDFVNCA